MYIYVSNIKYLYKTLKRKKLSTKHVNINIKELKCKINKFVKFN